MNHKDIDIIKYEGDGYQPLIDFESWRIAYLRYCEELEVPNLKTMQRHNESDEVFVLLAGHCTLYTGGEEEEIGDIKAEAMEQYQLYNVKKGVWHTHTLEKETTVLIVENQNTSDANSPTRNLTQDQIRVLREL